MSIAQINEAYQTNCTKKVLKIKKVLKSICKQEHILLLKFVISTVRPPLLFFRTKKIYIDFNSTLLIMSAQ